MPTLLDTFATSDPQKLRDAMAKVCPEHAAAAPLWDFTRDAYEGEGGFACNVRAACTSDGAWGDAERGSPERRTRGTYLKRFPRESEAHFTARAERSAYSNYVAPIIDTYHGHLTRRRPRRESASPTVTAWWQDVDGRGHDINEWMAPTMQRAQLFGWRAVLVDRGYEEELDSSSSATVVRSLEPEELRAWQVGADGALDWVRLGSCWRERDAAGVEEIDVEVYTVWTRDEWAQVCFERPVGNGAAPWTVSADYPKGGAHSLGRVPVAVLRWQAPVRPRALLGVSQVARVLPHALALYNTESEHDDHLANQNFAFLAVQAPDRRTLDELKLGTNDGMVYPPGCVTPAYVAPPSDVAVQYALREETRVRAIYAAANLERPSAEAGGGDAASGVAKAYDFAATDAALQSFARECARFEYELVDLVARWESPLSAADVVAATVIEYPQRFDARGVAEDLGALFAVLDEKVIALMPPKAVALAVSAIVAAVFPEASAADAATLAAEIQTSYERAAAASKGDAPKVTELFGYDLDAGLITVNQYLAGKGLPPAPDGDVTIIEWRVLHGLNPDGTLPDGGAPMAQSTVAQELDAAFNALPPDDGTASAALAP